MMRTIFKTKRLSFLSLLAGMTYVFLVISSFAENLDDFKSGYYGSADNQSAVVTNHFYFLNLRPVSGFTSFPDSLINKENNKSVRVKFSSATALASEKLSTPAKWYNGFEIMIFLLLLINYIFIPIHFTRFMKLIDRNVFFEKENIGLLRLLGFELLIVYFGNVLLNFMDYEINISIFSFTDYKIVMAYTDGIWLLFGIVVLLIAEILSKALMLKEEQELTI